LESILGELKAAMKEQNPKKSAELTTKALEAGADPLDLLSKVVNFSKELTEKSWWSGGAEEKQQASESEALMLSDLIMIGECLKASADLLKPALKSQGKKVENTGTIVIGTIEGDVHDIGKSLVNTLYESAGYTVKDIGTDVPARKYAVEAKRWKADIVGISISMAPCKATLPLVIKELQKLGLRHNVKIIDGGQSSYLSDVEKYGIDAHGLDASDALTKTDELMRILKEERVKGEVK
jgi:trimethylamine corrinoid protein